MIEVTVEDAAPQLEELVDLADKGEEAVSVRHGQPVARLLRCSTAPSPRIAGRCAGRIVIVGDFNAPLPDDVVAAAER